MGFGLTGYQDYANREYLRGLEGTYSRQVAVALGLGGKLDMMAYPGFRAKEALRFLGCDVTSDEYFEKSYRQRIFRAVEDSLCKNYSNAGDVYYKDFSNYEVGSRFTEELSAKDGDKKLVLLYAGAADVFFATTDVLIDCGYLDMSDIPGTLMKYVELLWNNFSEFAENYPALVSRIKELNPGATIVMIGTYNPLKDLALSKELIDLQIGDAFALLSGLINETVEKYAKQFGGIYVDIANTETDSLKGEYTVDMLLSTDDERNHAIHPNQDGYDYIARQILSSLEVCRFPSTNISVDLGSVKSVSNVRVNSDPVNLYHYDSESHTLTVPYLTTDAETLTVTEIREDGSVYVAVYTLEWNLTDGYRAQILYNNKNIIQTLLNILKLLFSLFSNLFGAAA